MSAAERFLRLLRNRGMRVRLENGPRGGTIFVGPPDRVTADIRAGMQKHRSALLMLLEGEQLRQQAAAQPAPQPWCPPQPLESTAPSLPEAPGDAMPPPVAQGVQEPAAPAQSPENAVQAPAVPSPAHRAPPRRQASAVHPEDADEMRPCGGGCGRMTYRGWACSRCNQKLADIELRRGRNKEG